jgi:L-seryl-tRNA(Ser) seleniumtransferase
VARIARLVETVPGVKTQVYVPDDGNRYPTLRVTWDEQAFGFTVSDCVKQLHDGDPVIEALSIDNPSMVSAVQEGPDKAKPTSKEVKEQNRLELVSMTIQPGEEMIVGQRLRSILNSARKGKAA